MIIVGLLSFNAMNIYADEDDISPWIESVEAENGVELLNGNGGLGQEYMDALRIRVYACDAGGSGIDKIVYYTVNQGVSSGENTVNLDSELSGTIVINGEFQGSIFFRAIDRAGNQGDYVSVNNICVQIKKEEEHVENPIEVPIEIPIEDAAVNEESEAIKEDEIIEEIEKDNPEDNNNEINIIESKTDNVINEVQIENNNDKNKPVSSNKDMNDTKDKTSAKEVDEKMKTDEIVNQIKEDKIAYIALHNKISNIIKIKSEHKGSSFYLNSELEKANGNNIKDINNLKILEENMDVIDTDQVKIYCICNGTQKKLVWPVNYTIEESNDGSINEYVYSLNENIFYDDGLYQLNVNTVDSYGNNNQYVDKIRFIVDRVEPVISFLNVDNNQILPEEMYDVKIMIKDNIEIKSIKILLDGEIVDAKNYQDIYEIRLYESNNARNISVEAEDEAGNVQQLKLNNIVVSTDPVIRFVYNKKLLIGMMMVFIGLISIITIGVLKQKNTKQEKD